MGAGLTPLDRFPGEDVRIRRAFDRLGIQLQDPSGLTISFSGIAVDPIPPIYVDANGVGLNTGNGLELSGDDLVAKVVAPITLSGSGIGLSYSTAYFTVFTGALYFANPITADINTTAHIRLDGDNRTVYWGADQDMLIRYTGTVGQITTDLVNPSDLDVDCGTEKTLRLVVPVYRDTNVGGVTLFGPPGQQPGTDQFVDSTGTATGIHTYAVAVGEALSGSFELQHDYDEGTDIQFHVHWQGIAAPTGTDNVRWQLTYTIARNNTVVAAPTTIAIETPFDTQYEMVRSDFAAITGTTLEIGDQFLFTLKRIASVGDAYAGDALLATVGIHYRVDTLGSRTLSAK